MTAQLSHKKNGRRKHSSGISGAIEFLFAWGRGGALSGTPHHRGGSSRRPRRNKVPCAGPRRRGNVGRAGSSHPARSFAPAAQCGGHPRGGSDGADAAPGCMLRYRISPHPTDGGAGFRVAAPLRGRRGAALRLSRFILRIHRLGAANDRPPRGRGPHRGGASRQRRQHVRNEQRPERCYDHEFHGVGRADDGHTLRRHRSRRAALPDRSARHGRRALCSNFFTNNRDCSESQEFPATCARCSRVPTARAAEALDLFVYRINRELGSLAAALGGLDALVFTGGIGENAVSIRARVCRDASWLGLELDEEANANGGPCISRKGSRVSAWVIPTNEELMIALHTRRLLGSRI